MNHSRKINTPLTLCASALFGLLALNGPAFAAEPDDELEVTMDVVDDGDHAATTGAELVVREDHDADDASHDSADHESAEHDSADEDLDSDADRDADETDEATEHEEPDDSDVNDDGQDGAGEHSSDQPDASDQI